MQCFNIKIIDLIIVLLYNVAAISQYRRVSYWFKFHMKKNMCMKELKILHSIIGKSFMPQKYPWSLFCLANG